VRAVLDGLQFVGGGPLDMAAVGDVLVECADLAALPTAMPPPRSADGEMQDAGWKPVCHCVVVGVSDVCRLRTLTTWGLDALPAPGATMQGRYASRLPGGVAAHDCNSLAAAMHLQGHTLSIISMKTGHMSKAGPLVQLFVNTYQPPELQQQPSENQRLMMQCSFPMGKSHIVLIAPSFTGGKAVLQRERENSPEYRRSLAAKQQAQAQAAANAARQQAGNTQQAAGQMQQTQPSPATTGMDSAASGHSNVRPGTQPQQGMVPMNMMGMGMGMTPPMGMMGMGMGQTPPTGLTPNMDHYAGTPGMMGHPAPGHATGYTQQQQSQQQSQQSTQGYAQPGTYAGGQQYQQQQQQQAQQQGRGYPTPPQMAPQMSMPNPQAWQQQQQQAPQPPIPAPGQVQGQVPRQEHWRGRLFITPTLGFAMFSQPIYVAEVSLELAVTDAHKLPNWASLGDQLALRTAVAPDALQTKRDQITMVKLRVLSTSLANNQTNTNIYMRIAEAMNRDGPNKRLAAGDVPGNAWVMVMLKKNPPVVGEMISGMVVPK